MSDFTDGASSNGTKGAVHGAVLTLAALCAIYNACAWGKRRERHLAVNAVVYGALVAFEVRNVRHHCQSPLPVKHAARC